MAAAVLDTVNRHSAGDMTLHIFKFSSVADTNDHVSGLPNVLGFWANAEANETAGEEGVNVSESGGTFTFGLKSTGVVTLYVYSLT